MSVFEEAANLQVTRVQATSEETSTSSTDSKPTSLVKGALASLWRLAAALENLGRCTLAEFRVPEAKSLSTGNRYAVKKVSKADLVRLLHALPPCPRTCASGGEACLVLSRVR